MKIFNLKSVIGLFLLPILLMATGCKKQLDINQNPNVPTYAEGSPMLAFPAGVLATVGKVGGDLAILGGIYSEYYTQANSSNQYKYIDAYDVKSTDFNAAYDILYSNGLKNYQYVIDKSKASGDWAYYLMGTVMKAYTTAILVDLYDKIPYFEALQGTANLQPKFDDGLTIYNDLLKSIDTALSKDFTASTNSVAATPGYTASDLVFGGDISKWEAFANTLKLKLYLRMINAQPALASAGIAALYSSNAVFLTADASVTNFTDAPGKDNPFYEQNVRILNTPDNIRASSTLVSWLVLNKDPRVITYFGSANPNTINQGDFNGTTASYATAPDFVQKPTDPVLFISTAESYFLQAEADLRYFGGTKTQALYNKGVLAAFAATGNDGTTFIANGAVYAFPATGTTEQKIEAIIVQKWASFPYGCHAIEGFFERNRTGYPKSSPVYSTSASYVPGQFVVAINSVLSAGLFPKRLVFPYDETSRNSNAPALVPSNVAVWWGK